MPAGEGILSEVDGGGRLSTARTADLEVLELGRRDAGQDGRRRQDDRALPVYHCAHHGDGLTLGLALHEKLHGHDGLEAFVEKLRQRGRRGGERAQGGQQDEAAEKAHGLIT